MPPQLIAYIMEYGYIGIAIYIFLQEVGFPNPLPNEIALMFFGYLGSQNILNFPIILFVVVAAEIIGTTTVYAVCYFFGKYIFAHRPKWFPISEETLAGIQVRIEKKRWWGIYLGRLIPYLRGYTSAVAGFLRIRPSVFLSPAIAAAFTLSGGYTILGYILGPYWEKTAKSIGFIQTIIFLILIGIFIIFLLKRRKKRTEEKLTV